MYTAVARTDEWMRRFGIDVEEIDQWEIVRRSELVPAAQAAAGRQWLEKHAAGVHYDGTRLTPEILERQVRSYHAMRDIIDEWHLDFSGIKGQPELTNNFATTDIAEAFLNDPYDWDGPKDTHICATECDMDGALTMLIMHRVTGTPVLFADVRHYFTDRGIWDLENSGQHATWFAARSEDPAENMAQVHLYPEEFYFPAGGASVHHLAAAGDITLGRLSRADGRYRMQVTLGPFRALRRRDQRGPHAPEHLRLATRLYPDGRTRRGVPVALRRQPHPRRPRRHNRRAGRRLPLFGHRPGAAGCTRCRSRHLMGDPRSARLGGTVMMGTRAVRANRPGARNGG